eukprot:360243-Chlamydomonas_euryale.AAC.4
MCERKGAVAPHFDAHTCFDPVYPGPHNTFWWTGTHRAPTHMCTHPHVHPPTCAPTHMCTHPHTSHPKPCTAGHAPHTVQHALLRECPALRREGWLRGMCTGPCMWVSICVRSSFCRSGIRHRRITSIATRGATPNRHLTVHTQSHSLSGRQLRELTPKRHTIKASTLPRTLSKRPHSPAHYQSVHSPPCGRSLLP